MPQANVPDNKLNRCISHKYTSICFECLQAPKPKNCFLDLTVHQEGLNEFLRLKVRDLPYVQPISSFEYMSEEERIVVRQPFHEYGSLRDLIHKEVRNNYLIVTFINGYSF